MTWKRSTKLTIEALEMRLVPTVVIPLSLDRDQFGDQIVTLQRYHVDPRFYSFDGFLHQFAIFDTGSPFVSFGYYATQQSIGDGDLVPVKVPGGAFAQAIGGPIFADVGMPGQVDVQGLGGLQFSFVDEFGDPLFPPEYQAEWTEEVTAQLVQPMVTPIANGDYRPEYELPTLSGMPLLAPSAQYPEGRAALIDFTGVTVDFTTIQLRDDDGDGEPDYGNEDPWVIQLPELQFVAPGTALTAEAGETPVIQIPLTLSGQNNLDDPGIDVSRAPVPVQRHTSLGQGAQQITERTFLLDTGAQLTTISVATARALGLDLDNPLMTTTIIGAAGRVEDVPGFVLDTLTMPLVGGDSAEWTDVPVFVIDVPGYDGVLGTNLFGPSSRMLVDPFAPGGPVLSIANFGNRPDVPAPISDGFFYTLQQAGLLALLDDPSGFPLPGANFRTGQISGVVYHDVDLDRRQTDADRELEGATVFVDLNRNGRRDTQEPFTQTGATGIFSFSGLIPNRTYSIRQELYGDLLNREPGKTVRVRGNQSVTDLLFRNVTPPPQVSSVLVGTGQDRSSIREITITFDREATLGTEAIRLSRLGGRDPVISWSATSEFGQTVVTITFPNQDERGGSLRDGRYLLRIRSSQVTAEDGQLLDGNGNGRAGDDFTYQFHRQFGDMNGDGRINATDRDILQQALLQPNNPQYSGLDYNGDSVVNALDVAMFNFNEVFYRRKPTWFSRSML